MKYKVGDKVRIKSIDWYYENKDRVDEVACGNTIFIPDMIKYCDKIVTISSGLPTLKIYRIKEDGGIFNWTDEMIERLVEDKTLKQYEVPTGSIKIWDLPNGYIFKDENGNVINATKIVLEKKKKEYLKTFEECCKILGFLDVDLCFNADYRSFDTSKEQWKRLGLINQFYQLLICRDAYWKTAGEEMGLDGPWEPDWDDDGWPDMYYISWSGKYLDKEKGYPCCNMVLIFPTAEMRDIFYENFKELIEQCKELL